MTEEAEEIKTEVVKVHGTSASIVKTALTELDTGTDIVLKVQLSCDDFCDLRGKIVKIMAQDAAVKEIELTKFNGAENETDEFVVKTSIEPGEYTWTAVFPEQVKEGILGNILHKESSVSFSFIFKPHAISVAVWDIPSPIAVDNDFKIKVGIKCSANCVLAGRKIDVLGHKGIKVSEGILGDVPWTGSTALWWAEVQLKSPDTTGYYTWDVKFPKPDLESAHEEASYTFGFRTVMPPEHLVTVEVIDKDTKAPIKGAHVILHPYRADTDEDGVAKVEVPKGEYQLYVSKVDYETFRTKINVTSDIAIKAELLVPPVLVEDD